MLIAYGKLVRDEVPRLLHQRGISQQVRAAHPAERHQLIGDKLAEKAIELLVVQQVQHQIDALVEIRTLYGWALFVTFGDRYAQDPYVRPYLPCLADWHGVVDQAELFPLIDTFRQATTKEAIGKAVAGLLWFDTRFVKSQGINAELVRQRLLDKRRERGDFTRGLILVAAEDGFAQFV